MIRFFFSVFQLSFAHLASNFSTKDVKVAELKRNCPSMQTDFWDCMNHTFNGKFRLQKYYDISS